MMREGSVSSITQGPAQRQVVLARPSQFEGLAASVRSVAGDARASANRTNASARECPLLAQSGHGLFAEACPLLGVKRTSIEGAPMCANDPLQMSKSFG